LNQVMPAYCLAGHVFATKEALKQKIRAVRDRTPLGGGIDDAVVLHLLRMHPQWAEKSVGMTAVGTAMVKGSPSAPPQKQIVLLRGDQEPMDISWSKLVARLQPDGSLRHPTEAREALEELRAACRQLIEPQLSPLRQPGMHVDHVFPRTFERLLFDWVQGINRRAGVRVRDIRVASNDGLVVARGLEDPRLESQWVNHHEIHADLELVTPEEHATRPVPRMNWEPLL
jgi:hypothetical protein